MLLKICGIILRGYKSCKSFRDNGFPLTSDLSSKISKIKLIQSQVRSFFVDNMNFYELIDYHKQVLNFKQKCQSIIEKIMMIRVAKLSEIKLLSFLNGL